MKFREKKKTKRNKKKKKTPIFQTDWKTKQSDQIIFSVATSASFPPGEHLASARLGSWRGLEFPPQMCFHLSSLTNPLFLFVSLRSGFPPLIPDSLFYSTQKRCVFCSSKRDV